MPPRPHQARPPHRRAATPFRPRLRPWAVLPEPARAQLAQQVAGLLRRVREEARRADRDG